MITYDGETMSIAAWSKKLGIPQYVIQSRLGLGWSERDAITTPVTTRSRRHITIDGETLNIAQWSKKMGLGHSTISHRLGLGWSDKDAVLTPAKGSEHEGGNHG